MSRYITHLIVLFGVLGGNLPQGRADLVALEQNNSLAVLLNEPLDMKDFQNPMSLKEALQVLMNKFAEKGKDFPLVVDVGSFKSENPEGASVYDTQIAFTPFPKRLQAATVLEQMLSKVDPPNAAFLVRGGLIVVTTQKMASPQTLLQRTVLTRFHHAPFSEAIDELSALTGASIVIDNRVGDKLKTPVSASFKNDVSLESALQMLSDMVGLKMVALPKGIYITEPANAERMQKELEQVRARIAGEQKAEKKREKKEK